EGKLPLPEGPEGEAGPPGRSVGSPPGLSIGRPSGLSVGGFFILFFILFFVLLVGDAGQEGGSGEGQRGLAEGGAGLWLAAAQLFGKLGQHRLVAFGLAGFKQVELVRLAIFAVVLSVANHPVGLPRPGGWRQRVGPAEQQRGTAVR